MSQMNTEQGGHGEARLAEGRAEKLTPPGPLGRGTGLRLVLLTTLGGRHCHLRVALTPLKEADGGTRRPDPRPIALVIRGRGGASLLP